MDPNIERRQQRERLVTQLEKLTIAQQWLSESSKKDDEDGLADNYGQLVDSFLLSDTGDADDVGDADDKTRAFQ
jgi:hypothetical protein